MFLPGIVCVAYFQVPTKLFDVDDRYPEEKKNTKPISSRPRRMEKAPLLESEEPDAERPWETYGISEKRYRNIQKKNDANMSKIHSIIKKVSKEGPSAW
eukprot:CAMPEP_0167745070 /NCGR_PEP_ID=MMETSP0110_2-20121227/2945_1 /TAXON_ID=629695 /ORGANISM="Gymnochlora sp., Strain CCMP2014" /LENGTH=98 /DNA_ID=CAMNT_0007629667 /DNA_START=169 /DNA_END=462 /DNA_ORIENTATION=-